MSRKQLEKITDNQLIEFAIKLQIKMITKVTELINDSNMEFQEKLRFINSKFDKLCRRLRKINRFIHFTDIHGATSKAWTRTLDPDPKKSDNRSYCLKVCVLTDV